ncbi:uncharacterized protein LOC142984155 isoform X2 [Anticarsia gemmatalis]|uniref:uncharacterized protein LOC142984155 isoform X2 n=1 Tax=Anticarsia gemmatalis TaxID=129554 RepID=UPI003F76BDBC
MSQCCFICNNRAGVTLRNSTGLFGEHNVLQSGKKVFEVVSEIIEKPIIEKNAHSSVLCKKCFKSCSEFDLIKTRLHKLRRDFLEQFKQSLAIYSIDYDTYGTTIEEDIVKPEPAPPKSVVLGKKLVLPASKLQPIPPDLLLKVGKLPPFSKTGIIPQQLKAAPSTLNLKVTVGSSVLTQTIKTTTTSKPTDKNIDNNILSSLTNSLKHDMDNIVTSQASITPKTSILNFNVNSLPKNFLSGAVMKIGDDDKIDGDKNNDDHEMEIDEDCSLSLVSVSTADNGNLALQVEEVKSLAKTEVSEFLNVSELPSLDGTSEDHKYILGKVQILNGEGEEDLDDDEAHTIVVDSEDGSILRMVSGQKFIYEGGEISLVMADEQNNDSNDLQDEQDSNDETAIELQMAGDEETAKAILAAAQEQGGAFIKVESGEMFRVQTVEPRDTTTFVAKDGDHFKCLLCEKSGEVMSGDADSVMRHMKRVHDARLYICQFCGAMMKKRQEFSAHIAEHAAKLKSAPAKQHLCTTCGRTFSSRAALGEHAHVHAGLRPYACSVCHKKFASKYSHQAHLKTHSNRPRPFKCSQCGKSFLTQQNLIQHEKTHTGLKEFVCGICNKAFSTQHNLEVHGVVHSGNKSFVCPSCGKAFARRPELRDHVRTHTGERPFSCDICGARFTQRSNLHSHRRATHLDDKRYACTLCPKKFKRRRLLEYHIKACHTGERPLKCDMCGSSFVYPEHYKKHIRIHSGEKPYVCEICGKSFNSRDNRNTHRFVHSDKKPYECVACGAGYMRKQLLYAHMNTSGHLAESIVVNQPRVIKVSENVAGTQLEFDRSDSQSSDKFDTIFEATELDPSGVKTVKAETEIEETKLILQDEKGQLSLIQGTEDPTLLTLHNLGDRSHGTILEAVSAEQTSEPTEIVANDENGEVVRLIQIKLPDGNNGWVAFNRL